MTYESGNLRNIRFGNQEVIRMIYVALRDKHWGTIQPETRNEKINVENSGFHISYTSIYKQDDIYFECHISILGNEKNQVIFEIVGESLSDFLTNRTGFCVLHPIDGCSGEKCEITFPDGKKAKYLFPKLISPHQPMKNIAGMSWDLGEFGKADITFTGEVFEMEDQRNWTDDSYKTYCRPLELIYPYLLKKGEKVHQRITLKVVSDNVVEDIPIKPYQLTYDENINYPLPKIGIGRRRNYTISTGEIELLGKIGFDHYDVDVVFDESWQHGLKQALLEAKELDLTVRLKVWFSDNYQHEINELLETIGNDKNLIQSILILELDKNVVKNDFLSRVVNPLKKAFPKASIGAGAAGFFAELNRNRITHEKLDFISYSMNPQVHAFDNLTLIENLKGQSATVETARSFAGGKEIHISPITFKIQKLPAAQVNETSEELLEQMDVRQMSLFGAGWTLGSIKHNTESRAKSVTYFETVGAKGIIQGDRDPHFPDQFHTKAGAVFPMYYVFREILKHKRGMVFTSTSSHPLDFEGLVLQENGKKTMILANFTNKQLEVGVNGIAPDASVKKLDEKTVMQAMYEHDNYENSPYCDFKFEQPITTIKMRPYALVIINE